MTPRWVSSRSCASRSVPGGAATGARPRSGGEPGTAGNDPRPAPSRRLVQGKVRPLSASPCSHNSLVSAKSSPPRAPSGAMVPRPRSVGVPPAGSPFAPAPRVAIVLAAGRSLRLRAVTGGGSKALVRLGGLPLVERAVRSLWGAGIDDVVVVVGYNAGPVAAVVSRLARAGPVRAVLAQGWELGNGASLRAARSVVEGEEPFVLMTADHLFSEGA